MTATRVPDVFQNKTSFAKEAATKVDPVTGQRVPLVNEYKAPEETKFRVDELEFGQTDFQCRFKPDAIDNPHFISEFNK